VRIVAGSVVALVDELDLLDEFLFLLIEVGVGGVDDESEGAGLGDRLGTSIELLDGLKLVLVAYRHYQL
jgi:hypothetical protein